MKRFVVGFPVLFVAVFAFADDPKTEIDPSKMEGKWIIADAVKLGKKSGKKALDGEVIIDKTTITIKSPEMTYVMKYRLDLKTKPTGIVLLGLEGPIKSTIFDGIIELKDDELKLCYAMPNYDRPTAFISTKKEHSWMLRLKRDK